MERLVEALKYDLMDDRLRNPYMPAAKGRAEREIECICAEMGITVGDRTYSEALAVARAMVRNEMVIINHGDEQLKIKCNGAVLTVGKGGK